MDDLYFRHYINHPHYLIWPNTFSDVLQNGSLERLISLNGWEIMETYFRELFMNKSGFTSVAPNYFLNVKPTVSLAQNMHSILSTLFFYIITGFVVYFGNNV